MRADDEKLVSQTLAGDRDAFGVLVHKYKVESISAMCRVYRLMHTQKDGG